MRAAYIVRPGPPETIAIGELPAPEPRAGQALVRVRAVSVNPIDTYIRAGLVPVALPQPFVVGSDFAGVVEEVGPGVTAVRPGDRVWGANQGAQGRQGTAAEFAAIDVCWLHPIPDGVSDETAAAAALVGLTAHLGLFARAGLRAGETVLVRGGAGGVGAMVIQMAKLAGATVIATAGSEAKEVICRDLGADQVIGYRRPEMDVLAAVRGFAPGGVDLWWETARRPDFELAVAALAPGGRMVVMAGRDARPPFPVGPFYVKNASVFGFILFAYPAADQREAGRALADWLAAGKVRPRIDRVLPLAALAEAHRLQEESTIGESGALAGKIVIRVVAR